MRILALGLGGAGCRIVNSLYSTDRRSSKVACVQALAIDVDSDTLSQLDGMQETAKLFFPPLDQSIHLEEEANSQTATIDIGEIVARIHNIESGETDAIFVCCGLGGSMVDIAPHLIATLRASVTEPIFGLITLPCLAEGERRSAKAADDIEMLSPLLDGIILFDNETWYKKTKAQRSRLVKKEKGLAEKLGFKKSEPEISPQLATYLLLNEAIVRRISLILRAGEFKADGGLDLAEVVLDSGEVLNTMKGMGYITIGYAVERLPHNPLSFLSNLRPTGFFADEQIKKASRIVDLAKQAIYHEISTPCDMTSAHKALILIAGPSHELSLKGFMTVRKWIDRSIAGLETRSGDYPVMNTKNVAIIVMLSGLENIPRLNELKEIQSQYKSSHMDSIPAGKSSYSETNVVPEGSGIQSETVVTSTIRQDENLKDEMLVLPLQAPKHYATSLQAPASILGESDDTDSYEYEAPHRVTPQHDAVPMKPSPDLKESKKTSPHVFTPTLQTPHKNTSTSHISAESTGIQSSMVRTPEPRRRIVVTQDHETQTSQPVTREPNKKHGQLSTDERLRTKDSERQRIERELQRQRMMAISGRAPKSGQGGSPHPVHSDEIVRLKRKISETPQFKETPEPAPTVEAVPPIQENRTVILQKKKVSQVVQEEKSTVDKDGKSYLDDDLSIIRRPDVYSRQDDPEEMKIGIKKSAIKSKDTIFEGKDIHKMPPPKVRDSALMRTELKSKKPTGESNLVESEKSCSESDRESADSTTKHQKKP